MKFRKFLSFSIIALILASYLIYYQNFKQNFALKEEIIFKIETGDSEYSIFQNLAKEELISNPLTAYYLFRFYKKLFHDAKFTSGEYQVTQSDNLQSLLRKFTQNDVYYYKITFAEGLSSKQIVKLLNENKNLSGNLTHIPSEGSLFPDTYYFNKNTSRAEIIDRMRKKMTETLEELWNERDPSIKINNQLEGLILASIIEKETSSDLERGKVSSVFHNRLKINMRLQSDPTVIYGITDGSYELNRPLSKTDLRLATPYNTYVIYNLPPTPIANPGYDSIKAAFNPSTTNYLYFVADGEKNHKFSSNLAQHNKYVRELRNIEKERKNAAKKN